MRQSLYVRSKAEAYSQKRFLAYQMGNQMKAIGISAFLNSMAPCMAQQFLYSIPKFLFAVKEKGISPQPFSDSHDPPPKKIRGKSRIAEIFLRQRKSFTRYGRPSPIVMGSHALRKQTGHLPLYGGTDPLQKIPALYGKTD